MYGGYGSLPPELIAAIQETVDLADFSTVRQLSRTHALQSQPRHYCNQILRGSPRRERFEISHRLRTSKETIYFIRSELPAEMTSVPMSEKIGFLAELAVELLLSIMLLLDTYVTANMRAIFDVGRCDANDRLQIKAQMRALLRQKIASSIQGINGALTLSDYGTILSSSRELTKSTTLLNIIENLNVT